MTAAIAIAIALIAVAGISLVMFGHVTKPDPDTEHWPT